MRMFGRDVAEEAALKYPDLRNALESWMQVTANPNTIWHTFNDIKQTFPQVKFVREMNGYVFKIRGNNYRLLAEINFEEEIVQIVRIGKHEDYDYW